MPNMSMVDTQSALKNVLQVLEPFLSLVNCHMVNFLSHDLWNTHIPFEIKKEVEEVGGEEVFNYIMENNSRKENAPLALQQYLQNAEKVSSGSILKIGDFWSSLEILGYKIKKSDPQLTMFMSPKKAHEVQVLSKVVASLTDITDVGCVIDLGGGKGYLGSTLAYHYGIRVLSVDCAQVNTHGAVKLAGNLKKWWDVMQDHGSQPIQGVERLYKQATSFVSPDTNLRELVQGNFRADADVKNLQNICLVGLHACGDLTPSCIRLFCANPDIKALCIVGCCYNLISEDHEENNSGEVGFPMSLYLKERGVKLGRNARMLAAQSMERITENNKPPPSSLWFRALLQMLLIERNESADFRVGRSKSVARDFSEYVAKALERLKLPQATPEEVRVIEGKYQKWRELHNIFFMMRVALAPVIEKLILLDRLLFLQEQGIEHTYLVQLFDSVISPRCCGIIVHKK